jgi:hypothetical protein
MLISAVLHGRLSVIVEAASIGGRFQFLPSRPSVASYLNALALMVLEAVLDTHRDRLSVCLVGLYAPSLEDGRAYLCRSHRPRSRPEHVHRPSIQSAALEPLVGLPALTVIWARL